MSVIHKLIDFVVSYFKVAPDRQQYFDEDINREQWDLLEAAAQLQVTEFRIFELSYKEWYGAAPKAQVIEVHFRNYMFNQIIPVWVSSFCRRIVELSQAGTLNPKDFGIYQRLPSRRMMRVGQVYTAMLVVAFMFLVYMAYYDEFFAKLLFTNANVYPPDLRLPEHNALP